MHRRIRATGLAETFDEIRRDAGIPLDFPADVLDAAAAAQPTGDDRVDMRSVPFVTVDPATAMDLDQAMAFDSLAGGGLRVFYAIADVAAFVPPGGPIDVEARRRGLTVYCPDMRVPLHPPVLSEGSASLLPGQDRPALVFEVDVDADGVVVRSDVVRATIESRQRYDYAELQSLFDLGRPPDSVAGLERFGKARIALGLERGALNLRLPEQESVVVDGRPTLSLRSELPVERWNAEVSLLTGMVAADLMLDAGVGVLRTLPEPDADAVGKLRGAAKSLGVAWTRDETPAELLAGLDPIRPRQLALFEEATGLLRGAGYLGFVGGRPDGDIGHSGVASTYSHVTAPLRRLVDRFGLEATVSAARGRRVPDWVAESVEEIASTMQAADALAGQVERRCLDAVEASVMSARIGETFDAIVIGADGGGVEVWIDEPPILVRVDDVHARAGSVIQLTVDEADPIRGKIRFSQPE